MALQGDFNDFPEDFPKDFSKEFSKDFSDLELTFIIEKRQEEFKGKIEDVVVLFLKNTSEISSKIAVEAYFKDKKGARRLIETTFEGKLILGCNLHFKMISRFTETRIFLGKFTVGFLTKIGI